MQPGEMACLEFVSDSPTRAAISHSCVLDPAPLHIVVADLGVVSVRLLAAGEHPAAAQIIHAQHALDVGHGLRTTAKPLSCSSLHHMPSSISGVVSDFGVHDGPGHPGLLLLTLTR